MKITNKTAARQGFHAVSGVVYADPGQTIDADLTAAQAARASRIEGVTVEGQPMAEAAPGVQQKGTEKRDANGDTPGEAQLRKQFDASWKVLESERDKLKTDLETSQSENTTLKDRIAELELEIEELKKGDGDNKTDRKYEAVHRGRGSWSVMDGDTEVVEGLDKAKADQFNALNDADKATFVEASKKKAG